MTRRAEDAGVPDARAAAVAFASAAAEEASFEVTGREAARIGHLWVTRGLENREVDEVAAGDIVWLAGPDEIAIGDTLAAPELEDAGACRRSRSKSRRSACSSWSTTARSPGRTAAP